MGYIAAELLLGVTVRVTDHQKQKRGCPLDNPVSRSKLCLLTQVSFK